MSEGPIPWTATVDWAARAELSEEQTDDLIRHISRMDSIYLAHRSEKK